MKRCPHCKKSIETDEKRKVRALKNIGHIRILAKMLTDKGKGPLLKERLTLLKTLKKTEAELEKSI